MQHTIRCPRCRVRLEKGACSSGNLYICPECDGRAVGVAVARKYLDPGTIKLLWRLSTNKMSRPGAKCPMCDDRMDEIDVPYLANTHIVALDLCRHCQFIWFDKLEMEQLPKNPVNQDSLSARARQEFAQSWVENRYDLLNEPDDQATFQSQLFDSFLSGIFPGLDR